MLDDCVAATGVGVRGSLWAAPQILKPTYFSGFIFTGTFALGDGGRESFNFLMVR